MDLRDCVALVTGGGGGLGKQVYTTLASSGVDDAVAYNRSRERAEETCALVERLGRSAACFHIDQTDETLIDAAMTSVVDKFGRLDILVNNAGAARGVPFGDINTLTPEIWDALMSVNLRGPFLVSRAAAPYLRRSSRGRIC